jgi:hypothetical protein
MTSKADELAAFISTHEPVTPKADELATFIATHEPVTFAKILNAFPWAKGELVCRWPGTNLILWDTISPDLVQAMRKLTEENRIYASLRRASDLYYQEGHWLILPIGKLGVTYNEPHWLPVVIVTEY